MRTNKIDYIFVIRKQIRAFMKVMSKLNIPIFLFKTEDVIEFIPCARIFSNENSNIMRGIIDNPTFQKSINFELSSNKYKKYNIVTISKFKEKQKYNHKTGKILTRISKLFDIEYDKINYLASVF